MRFTHISLNLALLLAIVVGGIIASIIAIGAITKEPAPYLLARRTDFSVGPIHGTGAVIQWIISGGETLEYIAIRPAGETTPQDLRLRALLVDEAGVAMAESEGSVDALETGGWVRLKFPRTSLVTGRRYGIRISPMNLESEYLYLEATNHRRIGWAPPNNGGLEVNGAMHAAQALRMRVTGAGGLRASLWMLAQAAEGAPESAGALAVGAVAWFITGISLLSRMRFWRKGRVTTAIGLTAVISLNLGTDLAAIAWLLG